MTRSAFLAVVLVGCSSGDGGGDDGERAYAERACLELVDAVATYDERCRDGVRYQDTYDDLLEAIACGDCDNIVSVRDHDEFEGQCVPWLEAMTCERWLELSDPADLDSSCQRQLERSAFAGDCPAFPQ